MKTFWELVWAMIPIIDGKLEMAQYQCVERSMDKRGTNYFISSTMVPGTETLNASSLFDTGTESWNIQLITQLFNSEDQNRIRGMSLRCRDMNNTLVWNRSRDGRFLVKSTYYVAMNEFTDTSELRIGGDWGLIWKMQIPSKVKLQLWRSTKRHFTLPVQPATTACTMPGGVPTMRHCGGRRVAPFLRLPASGGGVEDCGAVE